MRSKLWVALGACVLALAILPASASATGSSESESSGGNCSSSGALIAANCTNISGPQTQVGGGLVNEQNQSNNQQNGDNSGTSNANTNAVAVGNSQPSDDYEGDSEPSGSGGNCSQHGAIIAANCTNYSAGQYQAGGGLVNQQNQSNNQQNGDNSGTSNANTNAVAVGNGNSQPSDGYDGNHEPSGSGGNCSQKATFIAANCSNISKGQEQVGGGGGRYEEASIVQPGGGSLVNQQNQSNNQQNGDNSGTSNENANVIAVGHGPSNHGGNSNSEEWDNNNSHPSGSGGNCSQFLTAVSANCTNISKGQYQGNGGEPDMIPLAAPPGGGGSLVNQQNQSNNQQNGDNSGTYNENANVIAVGHGPSNHGGNNDSEEWDNNNSHPSGSGGNCSQTLTAFALNCTNYSGGQWQSNGGRGIAVFAVPGGGGSLVNQQNQSNNQQNGDNSGTSNENANVIAVGHGPSNNHNGKSSSWDEGGNSEHSGSGGNCSQFLTAVSANCTNISKGQWQSNGGGANGCDSICSQFVQPGGGGSLANQQNQSNNQQNGDNSGTSNENANVIAVGHGPPRSNGYEKSEPWRNGGTNGESHPRENRSNGNSHPSEGGGNCTQSFTLFAANCTNYSGGQWQSNGGRRAEFGSFVEPGGGGSLVNQQNQGNNQQNGDNSGTHNYEQNVIIVPGRRYV